MGGVESYHSSSYGDKYDHIIYSNSIHPTDSQRKHFGGDFPKEIKNIQVGIYLSCYNKNQYYC